MHDRDTIYLSADQDRQLAAWRDETLAPYLSACGRREIDRLAGYLGIHWTRVYGHRRGWVHRMATLDYLAALEPPDRWPACLADLARWRRRELDMAAASNGRAPYEPKIRRG